MWIYTVLFWILYLRTQALSSHMSVKLGGPDGTALVIEKNTGGKLVTILQTDRVNNRQQSSTISDENPLTLTFLPKNMCTLGSIPFMNAHAVHDLIVIPSIKPCTLGRSVV